MKRVFDVEDHEPGDLRHALSVAGLRWTSQREAVYQVLKGMDPEHPRAEQIFHEVRRQLPKISLATVYKALDALEACGKVTRLAGAEGSARFDARDDRHYHLRCLRTGRVEDLSTPYDPDLVGKLDPELADRLRTQGFQLMGYRLELVGYFDPKEST